MATEEQGQWVERAHGRLVEVEPFLRELEMQADRAHDAGFRQMVARLAECVRQARAELGAELQGAARRSGPDINVGG